MRKINSKHIIYDHKHKLVIQSKYHIKYILFLF